MPFLLYEPTHLMEMDRFRLVNTSKLSRLGGTTVPKAYEPEFHELAKYYDLIKERYVPYDKHFAFIESAFEEYRKKVHTLLSLLNEHMCPYGNLLVRHKSSF